MSEAFERTHRFTAYWEEKFSNGLDDKNEMTAWGVSLVFLEDVASTQEGRRRLGELGVRLPAGITTLLRLSKTQARHIFQYAFWDQLKLDTLPFRMAALLYDAAVNCGCEQAVKLAQRGYNRCVGYGVRLAEDGVLGKKTRGALTRTDTDRCVQQILDVRREFYRLLAARDSSRQIFLNDWLHRVNSLESFLLQGRIPGTPDQTEMDDEEEEE